MTRQELLEEMKEMEGRPEVKAQIRRMQQQLASRRMMEAVPSADVVVVNPTHYAVALKYDPKKAQAPIVVATLGPAPSAPLAHPCGGCDRGCRPAFERALMTLDGAPSEENLRASWRAWLACRDSCPIGREHRYSDAQIRYHYTRSRDALSEAMTQTSASPEK